jgi:predicted  nucleic acid-binding Zn-ribbon protein
MGSSPSTSRNAASAGRAPRIFILLLLLAACLLVVWRWPRPGRTVLTYRIGSVDPRFGLTRGEFSDAVARAVLIWREPVSRILFRESPRGDIEINLVYDHRQEALDRLRAMSQGISRSTESIQGMKSSFDLRQTDFETKRDLLKDAFDAYGRQVAAFNGENEALRARGNATEEDVRRLGAQREALNATLADLKGRQEALEADRAALEEARGSVNSVVAGQKTQISAFRETSESLREEFDEGLYVRHHGVQTITIYSFPDSKTLVRVIAHELGHAMGFHHAQDPRAIMYARITSDSWDLAPEDLADIRAVTGTH